MTSLHYIMKLKAIALSTLAALSMAAPASAGSLLTPEQRMLAGQKCADEIDMLFVNMKYAYNNEDSLRFDQPLDQAPLKEATAPGVRATAAMKKECSPSLFKAFWQRIMTESVANDNQWLLQLAIWYQSQPAIVEMQGGPKWWEQ